LPCKQLTIFILPSKLELAYRFRQPIPFVGLDLNDPDFERHIAGFIGSHFKCYFLTYWMTDGEV
jgi:hypothetical protein